MTDPDQPQDFAVVQISKYLQQLILLDMLAKVFSAQQKGGDYLPLLKSLTDYVESQGVEREKPEQHLIAELCSLAARADSIAAQQGSERCTND